MMYTMFMGGNPAYCSEADLAQVVLHHSRCARVTGTISSLVVVHLSSE